MRKPSQSTRKSYSLSHSKGRGLMKRCSSFSFFTSRASSSCFPFMVFSLAASEASPNSNKPSFHSINNKVSFLSVPETNTIDHVRFIKDFSSLIRNLSINSKDYGALRSLDSLLNKTHFLDSATSVVVIDGLCSLNKLTRAITVLSNVRKKGNVPYYFLYSLVFHRMVREGRIDGVEFVWNEVFGSESSGTIDASGYVIYICKYGNLLEIESICKRVLVSDGVLKQQSYIALIGALCREHKTLLVKQVLLKMKSMGYEPDGITYFTVFQCFCRNGYLAEADLILRELFRRKYNMDICIFGNFMYGLCKRGMLKEADKLFHKLVKNEKSSSRVYGVVHLKEKRRAIFQLNCHGLVPEIMAYESYFKSLCSVGRLDEAKPLLKEMMRKRTVVEVCVYKSFIKALFRAGRSEDAIRFFNVHKTKGLVPVEEMAGSLISGLCQMGNVDDAWRIFNEINMNESFVSATNICNCILDCYWKLGRLVEAVNLFERMQHGSFGGPNISTYMVMVNGFCDEGKFFEALSIFEEMLKNNMSMNGTLYEVIIRGLCLSRKLEEAHKYLNKMIEDGQLVSYVRWKLIFDSMFVSSEAGLSFESNQCK